MDTVSDRSISSPVAPAHSLWQLVVCTLRLGSPGFGDPVALTGYVHGDPSMVTD